MADTNIAKKIILIGEDDKFYAGVYTVKLAKEGFDVQVVSNGEEVIAAAKVRKPDLMLLDLIMPVKDGFETLKEVKADPALSDVKVIISSSLEQKEDVDKAKSLGAVDFIVKTDLSMTDLIAKLKSYFQA